MALCSGSGGSVLGSGRSPTLFLTRNVSAFLVRIWLPVWLGLVWFGKAPSLFLASVAGGPELWRSFLSGGSVVRLRPPVRFGSF